MKTFDANRSGTGTAEWADINENICRGCPNDCLYCYAATNANRFKQRDRADWHNEELTKRAFITNYPKKNGVIMFPTAHDITPFNIEHCIRVLKLMLESGNEVLIVSKPRLDCTKRLLAELHPYNTQVMFRFTIGTMDEDVAGFWEPGAPSPSERLECLQLAHAFDYRTSVSAEPLLGGYDTALELVEAISPYVTDTIWIGKMNKISGRVGKEVRTANHFRVAFIESNQTDGEVLRIMKALDGNPLIRWKDSFKEVIVKYEWR